MSDWPEMLDLTLDGIAQGGEGVGRWNDRVVFVAGGLPGEHICVRLHTYHAAYAHGEIIEVLEASEDRVPPQLPGVAHMPWQHIAYPAQLRLKRQILRDQLAKFGGLADLAVEETLPASAPWAYRNSARFHSDGQVVGYYTAGTHDIQAIEADPLLQPALNEALAALREALSISLSPGIPIEIVMRMSEAYGYVLAGLNSPVDQRDLAVRWRARCPILAGVVLRTPSSAQPEHIGVDHVVESLDAVLFRLRSSTFFQVNVAAAEALLTLAREGLTLHSSAQLLDLYCGAGTFALPLARRADQVLGVESYAESIADAQTTAEENGITNVRFLTGRVEDVLKRIEGTFDTAILDPPRRGCHPQALAALLQVAPQRLVYVSCHPATLARDLKILVAGGYTVSSVQPVDLFPQTAHIESVCVLERTK